MKPTTNQLFGNMHGGEMAKDEWLTPPEIIHALGEFDLDPCAPVAPRIWETAHHHFTIDDDGLSQEWRGRVWCNPPYGAQTARWMQKLAEHGNGIALIFARTETKTFFPHVWQRAAAIFFFDKRIVFHHANGLKAKSSGGAPSCLVAYGQENVQAIEKSGLGGKLIVLEGAR